MKCTKCGSDHLANVVAKCSDRCFYQVGDHEEDGYVPSDVGIGGGDYIDFKYCLNCGQIQGSFPVVYRPVIDESES